VTVSVRFPVLANLDTVIDTLSWLALTNVTRPTVIPEDGETLTVLDDVKFCPLIVTVVVVFRVTEVGDIEVIAGAGAVTVKVTVLLVPPAVVTEICFVPVVALEAMVNVAVTEVAVDVVPVTLIPVGTLTVAPVRLVPAKVTATLAPCAPDVGVMPVSVGAAGALTVKVMALLVPPDVVAVMLWAPVAAVDAITNVAVI